MRSWTFDDIESAAAEAEPLRAAAARARGARRRLWAGDDDGVPALGRRRQAARGCAEVAGAQPVEPRAEPALAPIGQGIGSLFSGLLGSAFGGARFAKGGVVGAGVTPFAARRRGGDAELFPMRGGMGLMGEAGPEAILPLARGRGRTARRARAGGGRGQRDVQRDDAGRGELSPRRGGARRDAGAGGGAGTARDVMQLANGISCSACFEARSGSHLSMRAVGDAITPALLILRSGPKDCVSKDAWRTAIKRMGRPCLAFTKCAFRWRSGSGRAAGRSGGRMSCCSRPGTRSGIRAGRIRAGATMPGPACARSPIFIRCSRSSRSGAEGSMGFAGATARTGNRARRARRRIRDGPGDRDRRRRRGGVPARRRRYGERHRALSARDREAGRGDGARRGRRR